MQLQSLTPLLWVDDLKITIDFYTSVLGFTVDSYSDDWGWAHLHKDEVKIMFSLPNSHIPYAGAAFSGSFYLNTNNIHECWENLKDRTRVVYPLEEFEYGMHEFAIHDCNGYILQFGQPVNGDISI